MLAHGINETNIILKFEKPTFLLQHYFDEGKAGVAVSAECISIAHGVAWVVS